METPTQPDRGCDPIGDGTFKMWPSGDIVDRPEKERRLASIRRRSAVRENDCFGKSWSEIESMQGGRLIR
jgi:hypothetical protein